MTTSAPPKIPQSPIHAARVNGLTEDPSLSASEALLSFAFLVPFPLLLPSLPISQDQQLTSTEWCGRCAQWHDIRFR